MPADRAEAPQEQQAVAARQGLILVVVVVALDLIIQVVLADPALLLLDINIVKE
jgi:hypothetical protein